MAKKAKTAVTMGKVYQPVMGRPYRCWSTCIYSQYGGSLGPSLAGVTSSLVYSLNGLYDPDVSGLGQQPTGFDQYMSLYEFYTVTRGTVEVEFLNADESFAALVGANIAPTDGTSPNANTYIRNSNIKYGLIEKYGTGSSRLKIKFDFDINKLSGQNVLNDDQYAGTVNANPANQWYLILWGTGQDISNNIGSQYFTLRISYWVEFRHPAVTANS